MTTFQFKEKEIGSNIHSHIPKFMDHIKGLLINKGLSSVIVNKLDNFSIIRRCLKMGIILQNQVSETGKVNPYMEYELYQSGGYYKFHRSYITKTIGITSLIIQLEKFD